MILVGEVGQGMGNGNDTTPLLFWMYLNSNSYI